MDAEILKLENQICFPLYAASRLVGKHYQPLLAELGITYPQYLVLLLLWEEDNRKVTDLGNCLLLETSTLTPLLKRMEQKGYINRIRSTQDERQVRISLTTKGSAARETASSFPARLIESLKQGSIKEEDIRHVKVVLDELIRLNRD